jgi:Cu-Zn family superoxide dismutase
MTARSPSPRLFLALAGLPLALAACAPKAPPGAPPPASPYAEALLYDSEGQLTGNVVLTPAGDALNGTVNVTRGLPAGPHGMHIHAIGECRLKDFASAGGHLNPGGKQHGLQNPMGSHAGDLPMLVADATGKGSATFTAQATLDDLFDADGASFVIHAGADDMKTDPAGNSGARVMCGVLYRKLR